MGEDIARKIALGEPLSKDERPRFTFKVPEKARQFPTDPTSLTYVPLRVQDEQDAMTAADAKGGKSFPAELLRRSVAAVDGKPINWAAGEDIWLDRASPKVREFAYLGYRKVNENTEEDKTSFLDSMVVEA